MIRAMDKFSDEERLFWLRVGTHIFELRKRACLNQYELARQIGKSRASIANLETGRQRINAYDLKAIEDILNNHIMSAGGEG